MPRRAAGFCCAPMRIRKRKLPSPSTPCWRQVLRGWQQVWASIPRPAPWHAEYEPPHLLWGQRSPHEPPGRFCGSSPHSALVQIQPTSWETSPQGQWECHLLELGVRRCLFSFAGCGAGQGQRGGGGGGPSRAPQGFTLVSLPRMAQATIGSPESRQPPPARFASFWNQYNLMACRACLFFL